MRNQGFKHRGNFSPVRVGEEKDVKIEAMGEKGDGIAKVNGLVIFVPNVKVGDEVRVRITKVLRNVSFAEVVGPSSGPVESKEESEENQSEEAEEEGNQEDSKDDGFIEDSEEFGEEEK